MATKPITRNPLIIALDVDGADRALALADDLQDVAGAFKIGPRLVLRNGPEFVRELAKKGPVFLDHKFFDIPSTMEAALRAAFEMNVSIATIHASAGAETLSHLAKVERELNSQRPFLILCVTVLTSVKANTQIETDQVRARVKSLAMQTADSGLRGLVCSPHELSELKDLRSRLFLVTPGIRSAIDSSDDQGRTMTAGEARREGASAVVVGRPILNHKQPAQYARRLLSELS